MARRSARTAPPAHPPTTETTPTATRFGWPTAVVLALAAAFPLMYLGVALLRIRFPFELEWMEGSMIEHLDRVRHGLPLYVAPTLAFTPFIYPPLYFWVSAALATVVGGGFLPLRLTSLLASLACLALVYLIVARGARSRVRAFLGACLFAATFRQGGAWLDIGRVDTLSLAFVLAGVWALRRKLVEPEADGDRDLDDAAATRESPVSAIVAGVIGG